MWGGGGGWRRILKKYIPVASTTTFNFPAFVVHHPTAATHVIGPAKPADLRLPHVLLAHELVDLVVEVADLEVAQAGLLDLGHLARNLLEHLAPPFLAHRDRGDGRDGFGTASARDVEDPQRRGLLGPEPKQHRLRLFRVARLVWCFMLAKGDG